MCWIPEIGTLLALKFDILERPIVLKALTGYAEDLRIVKYSF